MINNLSPFLPFVASIAGSLFFWLIGRLLLGRIEFNLGRGSYVGGLPQLGALVGLTMMGGFGSDFWQMMLVGTLVLVFVGFFEDLQLISPAILMLLLLLVTGVFYDLLGLASLQTMKAVVWCALIFVCLKIASLVYEMPFILTATSSLTILILFSQQHRPAESVLLTWAALAAAVVFLLYSSAGKRALTGSSGQVAVAFILAAVTFFENSGKLMLFALLIPSMLVFFPVCLISAVLIASYFGNRLHDPTRSRRTFAWTLERENTVVFSGMVFLCLNFLGLLVELQAPWYGYFALFVLLIASVTGFFRTFARRFAGEELSCAEQVTILDQRIDAITPDEVIHRIEFFLERSDLRDFMHIITADSLALLRCLEEERFRSVMNRAELVVPDGAGIVWASDFLGVPLPGRVPGVALVSELSRLSAARNFRVFLVGGKPGIAEKAAEKLRDHHPDLNIVGIQHGFFKPESEEEDRLCKSIAESRADLVLVALGVPRQEWFISRLRLSGHRCVAVGVGGSFDVISETLRRAPVWMQRFGIEWLFRLWLEPFRIGRIAKIPAFVLQVFRCKWNN